MVGGGSKHWFRLMVVVNGYLETMLQIDSGPWWFRLVVVNGGGSEPRVGDGSEQWWTWRSTQ